MADLLKKRLKRTSITFHGCTIYGLHVYGDVTGQDNVMNAEQPSSSLNMNGEVPSTPVRKTPQDAKSTVKEGSVVQPRNNNKTNLVNGRSSVPLPIMPSFRSTSASELTATECYLNCAVIMVGNIVCSVEEVTLDLEKIYLKLLSVRDKDITAAKARFNISIPFKDIDVFMYSKDNPSMMMIALKIHNDAAKAIVESLRLPSQLEQSVALKPKSQFEHLKYILFNPKKDPKNRLTQIVDKISADKRIKDMRSTNYGHLSKIYSAAMTSYTKVVSQFKETLQSTAVISGPVVPIVCSPDIVNLQTGSPITTQAFMSETLEVKKLTKTQKRVVKRVLAIKDSQDKTSKNKQTQGKTGIKTDKELVKNMKKIEKNKNELIIKRVLRGDKKPVKTVVKTERNTPKIPSKTTEKPVKAKKAGRFATGIRKAIKKATPTKKRQLRSTSSSPKS